MDGDLRAAMSPEDEERDHDQVLMDAVFETVDELAKVYAEGFADLCAGLRVWPDQCRPPPPMDGKHVPPLTPGSVPVTI